MKKLWKPALAALAALVAASTLTGCVTERVVMREPAPHPAAMRPMPAPVAEERGAAPGYGWNWVPGHWRWAGDNWLWVHGKWVQQAVPAMPPVIVEQVTVAPAPHAYWVQGHWVWRYDHGGGWAWVKGSWHG
jgi:hypothetical protein